MFLKNIDLILAAYNTTMNKQRMLENEKNRLATSTGIGLNDYDDTSYVWGSSSPRTVQGPEIPLGAPNTGFSAEAAPGVIPGTYSNEWDFQRTQQALGGYHTPIKGHEELGTYGGGRQWMSDPNLPPGIATIDAMQMPYYGNKDFDFLNSNYRGNQTSDIVNSMYGNPQVGRLLTDSGGSTPLFNNENMQHPLWPGGGGRYKRTYASNPPETPSGPLTRLLQLLGMLK